ncbi:hypothetical protein [Pseudarthrobacter siccitolerans]
MSQGHDIGARKRLNPPLIKREYINCDKLARDLVDRGLASPVILDGGLISHRRKTK